MRSGVP